MKIQFKKVIPDKTLYIYIFCSLGQ